MAPSPDLAVDSAEDKFSRMLDRLVGANEMLRGFNHRNKNQHRASKWWADFDALRRHTGKLDEHL